MDSIGIDPAVSARRRLGRTICRGKYRLDRLLGVGGMAAVYAATHRNGNCVAIKMLHDRLSIDQDIRRRFRLEGRLANKVDHPGVVRVLDDDVSDDGEAFLVMPLLEGETLRAIWEKRGRRLVVREVVAIANDLLGVLSAAHDSGVVHRDIKPENVFITVGHELKVLDFGVGRMMTDVDPELATRSGRAVGTPAFMAPEQALGRTREIDGQTDLWAVGAMMFTLLSGRYVHEAETASEAVVYAATKPSRALASVAPDVPPEIAKVVDRALAFVKRDRWTSATEMRNELEHAAAAVLAGRASISCVFAVAPQTSHVEDIHAQATRAPVKEPRARGPRAAAATSAVPALHDANGSEHAPTEILSDVQAASRVDRWATTRTTTSAPGSVRPHASTRRRNALIAGACLAIAVTATTAFVAAKRPWRSSHPPGAAATGLQDAAAEGASQVADASAAFRAGVQSWRDGSEPTAIINFERAITIDPELIEARLYLIVLNRWEGDVMRTIYQHAVQHRSRLTDRERVILEAYEPSMSVPANLEETITRLSHVREAYPADLLVLYALGVMQLKSDKLDDAGATFDRILQLDDRLMAAWHQKALVHAGRGDMQSMRATLDECLRRSPVATSCLQSLANLEANEGNCEETERLARIQLANGPPSRSALLQLATSIQSRGGAPEAVRAALDRSVAAATPETKRRTELFDNMVLEVLGGAFAQALATGDAWTAEIATSPYEEDRATLSKLSMYVPLELGNRQLAAKRAADFLVQRELWIPGPYFDYKILALRVQYLSGAISKATFVRERETWLQREAKKPRLVSNRGLRWTLSYARAVSTPDDAREALEALADYLPVTDPATRNVESDDAIGYTYFLAGRVDEGLPYLRRGARSCKAVIYPFEHTWANLHLGMALEKKGDVAGACGAYEVVRARWGNEPKSQSANFARSRQSTLGCVLARPQ